MKKKEELSLEEKKAILSSNIDIVYKFCHNNKNRYINDFENFESFISECIVMAYEVIEDWDYKRGALSTYLFNILQWKLLNKKNREKKIFTYSLETTYEDLQELDLIVENQILFNQQDADKKVLEFIYPLLNKYTKAHYLEGKTYAEMAISYGMKETSIKNAVYKNIKDIRKCLEEEYDG